MNYNKFSRVLGNTFSSFSFKRRLHDRKLPSVSNNYRNSKIINWIGVESPKKADINQYDIKKPSWSSTDINNKAEYDDEYSKDKASNWRED